MKYFGLFLLLITLGVGAQTVTPREIARMREVLHLPRPMASTMQKAPPQAILFISLGMPTEVLRQYARQSAAYGVPLVIRGLYHHSLHLTGERVFTILNPPHKPKIKSGIEINPLWFRTYAIKVVPTVVVATGSQSVRVKGNIPLPRALGMIERQSRVIALRRIAQSYLETHHA